MIKIDRLRGLSVGFLLVGISLMIAEFLEGAIPHALFPIAFFLVLSVVVEAIRVEFRDLRAEMRKQHQ